LFYGNNLRIVGAFTCDLRAEGKDFVAVSR